MTKLTAERLRELLSYDPETGNFVWIAKPSRKICIGAAAGAPDGSGYARIALDGRDYKAHRLAWLYQTGAWPKGDIDHHDGDRGNNKWRNLREATRSQNMVNKPRNANNTSGFKNVYLASRCGPPRWAVRLRVNGKFLNFGIFDDKKIAMLAANAAAWQHFGKFAKLDPEFIAEFRRWRALRNLANNIIAA